jgi:hypothetical protein
MYITLFGGPLRILVKKGNGDELGFWNGWFAEGYATGQSKQL